MNAPFAFPETGILFDVPNDLYHTLSPVSNSRLKDMEPVPAKYYGLHIDPDRPARTETIGQRKGTLLHTLVLEPLTFHQRYEVGKELNRNTEAWKKFVASVPEHKSTLKPSELAEAQKQAQSLTAHAEVAEVLGEGHAEASLFWIDKDTGVRCRCRPDWMHPTGGGWIILDLKTGPADPDFGFPQQAARMGYDVQAAFYADGITAATGQDVQAFVFGNVESTWPYLSSCVMLDEEDMAAGRAKYKRLLALYAQCVKTGQWPGYRGVHIAHLPAYSRNVLQATV